MLARLIKDEDEVLSRCAEKVYTFFAATAARVSTERFARLRLSQEKVQPTTAAVGVCTAGVSY